MFVPLAVPDVAVISDALDWYVRRLCKSGKQAPGVIVTESEGFRLRAVKAEELLERAREWWRLLGELK